MPPVSWAARPAAQRWPFSRNVRYMDAGGSGSAMVAVAFDPVGMWLFAALVAVIAVSPLVAMALAFRRGTRAGLYWSLAITLAVAMSFVLLVEGHVTEWASLPFTLFVVVLLPNLTFALLGTGSSAILSRRKQSQHGQAR